MSRPNGSNVEVVAADAVLVDHPQTNQAIIFKLNVDCFERLFDYLSLRDIVSLSQTCKRMKQIGGYYFRETFHDRYIHNQFDIESARHYGVEVHFLSEYIKRIQITNYTQRTLKADSFHSLNELYLSLISKPLSSYCDYFKDILGVIDSCCIYLCDLDDDFYELLLKHCTNLKRLHLIRSGRTLDTDWLCQTYPTLEYLRMTKVNLSLKNDELKRFFDENPKVKYLHVDNGFLWVHQDSLKKTNIQLDCLVVELYFSTRTTDSYIELLKQLHERGVYKTLHLIIFDWDGSSQLLSQALFIDKLRKLHLEMWTSNIRLSPLVHLQELYIPMISARRAETLAKNLVCLQRLWLQKASTAVILPIVRHAKRLNTFRLEIIYGKPLLKNKVLDAVTLNKERQQLDGARMVWIFVDEKIYLATKWAWGHLRFNLIDIKRIESSDWDRYQ